MFKAVSPTPVSGPATDAELRAIPLPVSGPFLTDAELRAAPVPVTTTDLTDSELRASPVNVTTGGLTDTELRAAPIAVAGAISTGGLTDAELRASPVPVSGVVSTGGLTDAELRASPVPVTSNAGTNLNTSLLALESTQTTVAGEIGETNESAAPTDTSTSGLNGLMKRLLTRFTTFLTLLPASLGQKSSANSLAVVLASDQSAVTVSSTFSETTTVPTQATKTVTAAGTPEALAVDGTLFKTATLVANKAARTPNTGTVYLGVGSTNDIQPIAIEPGEIWQIDAPFGQKYDLNDWYLDVATAGDGVVMVYS